MIGWIITAVSGILLFFILWRRTSKTFREHAEEPKYLFLESLGVSAPHPQPSTQQPNPLEDKDESTQP